MVLGLHEHQAHEEELSEKKKRRQHLHASHRELLLKAKLKLGELSKAFCKRQFNYCAQEEFCGAMAQFFFCLWSAIMMMGIPDMYEGVRSIMLCKLYRPCIQ